MLPSHFPQLPPASGRLVLWEQTDHWGLFFLQQIKRAMPVELPVDAVPLTEQAIFVASVEQLRETVETHPASFVFAEVTMTHYRELLARIPHWRQAMPLLRIAVICLELPLRTVGEHDVFTSLFCEAGAATVLSTRRELAAMIPVVSTHFANIPQRECTWRESIEQRLPWRNV